VFLCVCNAVGRLIHKLPRANWVMGITSLDNQLYLLRHFKTSEQVEVYDIDSYHLLHCLTVPGLEKFSARDIVACRHNRCAYISDSYHLHTCVHRVALSDATVTQWPVNDTPDTLSLTLRHGVLVTCQKARKIKEFSTDGELLHVITVPYEEPRHAVQLSSGQFIVCVGTCICLRGSDGSYIKGFRGPLSSDSERMHEPLHVAVDRNDFVFVIDSRPNNSLFLLSPSLTYMRDAASLKGPYWEPERVYLDCDRGRVYVAENDCDGDTCGQVYVFSA